MRFDEVDDQVRGEDSLDTGRQFAYIQWIREQNHSQDSLLRREQVMVAILVRWYDRGKLIVSPLRLASVATQGEGGCPVFVSRKVL